MERPKERATVVSGQFKGFARRRVRKLVVIGFPAAAKCWRRLSIGRKRPMRQPPGSYDAFQVHNSLLLVSEDWCAPAFHDPPVRGPLGTTRAWGPTTQNQSRGGGPFRPGEGATGRASPPLGGSFSPNPSVGEPRGSWYLLPRSVLSGSAGASGLETRRCGHLVDGFLRT